MILYIVRHGEPDYEHDSLLPSGVKQAKKAAKRLAVSGIDRIFSSPQGRAVETARETADLLDLPIRILPWAYELNKESCTTYPDGRLKQLSWIDGTYWMQEAFRNGTNEDFFEIEAVKSTGFKERYKMITEGLDEFLKEEGYERTKEGFYLPVHPTEDHVALFCHCAMTRVMMSHLLNIPYQYMNFPFIENYTGITIFDFCNYKEAERLKGADNPFRNEIQDEQEEKTLRPLVPRMICYGDVGHMYDEGEPFVNYSTHHPF